MTDESTEGEEEEDGEREGQRTAAVVRPEQHREESPRAGGERDSRCSQHVDVCTERRDVAAALRDLMLLTGLITGPFRRRRQQLSTETFTQFRLK